MLQASEVYLSIYFEEKRNLLVVLLLLENNSNLRNPHLQLSSQFPQDTIHQNFDSLWNASESFQMF